MTHQDCFYQEIVLCFKKKLCCLAIFWSGFMINTQRLIKTVCIQEISQIFWNRLNILKIRNIIFVYCVFYLSVAKCRKFICCKQLLQLMFIMDRKSLHMRIFEGLRPEDCIEKRIFVKEKNWYFKKGFYTRKYVTYITFFH